MKDHIKQRKYINKYYIQVHFNNNNKNYLKFEQCLFIGLSDIKS